MADDVAEDPDGAEGQPEPQKGYEEILEAEIQTGVTELERPARGLLLSGL